MRVSPLISCLLALVPFGVFAQEPAAPAPDDASAVVARQGSVVLTLADIDAAARKIPEAGRAAVFSDLVSVDRLLRTMLVNKQLAAEGRALHLDRDPAIAAEMAQAADTTLAQERVRALRKQVEENVPDQTALAKERYMADPSSYEVPRVVDVKHILIDTHERSEKEAESLAKKLYGELRAHPADFDADVEKYSDDASKSGNGGLIPDATSDRYVPEFREAAGKLAKVGEMSPPVKTQFGYHILKAVKVEPARKRSFDEVKGELVEKLKRDYVNNTVRDHVDGLRGVKLEPNMELVESLGARYAEEHSAPASEAR